MARRMLFFGLTLVLIAAVIGLTVRSCGRDKEPSSTVMERTEESGPSPTRVLNPQDLEVVLQKAELERKENASASPHGAKYEIEIRNHGKVPYREVGLRFVYGRAGLKGVEIRTHVVSQTISPGAGVKFADIRMDGFSRPARDPVIQIIYADIGTAPAPKR